MGSLSPREHDRNECPEEGKDHREKYVAWRHSDDEYDIPAVRLSVMSPLNRKLVGAAGFEPTTPSPPD